MLTTRTRRLTSIDRAVAIHDRRRIAPLRTWLTFFRRCVIRITFLPLFDSKSIQFKSREILPPCAEAQKWLARLAEYSNSLRINHDGQLTFEILRSALGSRGSHG